MLRFCLATLWFVACAKPAPISRIHFAPCMIRDARGFSAQQAECARFLVPEDWSKPEAKHIELSIARVAATIGRPEPDPIVLIPGGPGQGAQASFAPMVPALSELNRRRAILLIDPRGTGESAPLKCSIPLAEDGDDAAAVLACKDKLSGDPRQYHTDAEVKDLEAVRQALGVTRWNLYGGSYGSRVALEYMRTAPDALRSVVLDGVVPHDLVLGSTHQATAEAALHALALRAPDLVPELLKVKERLRKTPVKLAIEDPSTGKIKEQTLNEKSFVGLVRLLLYAPEASALLPLAVREAVDGHYERLVRITSLGSVNVEIAINPFSSFTVGCREDAPFMAALPAPTPFFGMGVAQLLHDVCAQWPADVGPKKAPVTSTLPALLLSGELDPVTPPAFAEQALRTLSNARHIVLKGTGHIALARGCTPHLVAEFYDKMDAKALDAKCLEPLHPFPIFTTAVGP
jgi:pimeloyl-ACP methyl ester carboxylesterase